MSTDVDVRMPGPVVRERGGTTVNGSVALQAGVALLVLRGLISVSPGEAKVLQLFGRHVGTARRPGPLRVEQLSAEIAARVSNLLVALWGDRATPPIVDADSLHH